MKQPDDDSDVIAPHVLIVDDNAIWVDTVTLALQTNGFRVTKTTNPRSAIALYTKSRPDVVLLDYQMPGLDGLAVLAELRVVDPTAAAVLLSGHLDVATTVRAMRAGADDVLIKTVPFDQLLVTLERAATSARLARRHRSAVATSPTLLGLLDDSPVMSRTFRKLEIVAQTDSPVLITGETGAGKGLAATLVHQMSPRADGPFIRINCASLSANFLEDELFGHERGAFTDAKTQKRGLFEMADGGTLFLDELGELAVELQAKLLTVLDEGRFRRLGGTHEIEVNVRIICATNRDIEQEVRAGRFRTDLFYRLAVLPVHIPALRERGPEEIGVLLKRLLSAHQSRIGRGPTRFSAEALGKLSTHTWPGNVREMRNVIEQAFPYALEAEQIEVEHLPALGSATQPSQAPPDAEAGESLRDMERSHIRRVLSRTGGNRAQSARILGITRATLYSKMRTFALTDIGLEPERPER
jgi:DNA-binding NtrC family response regulator